ncbi:hypothetical protein IDJ77_14400 [Mucilaginibacter sp. ZT4R22]|uniref:Glycosyltransferase involved in cell wall biosynthesis n=1 Tax=Mucilaginibacter pankratovii TaxID=2772110 RepID=A0ABR7WRR9_9SPHI|nr:hypothetical protein [Mucilaginibacter pankratovii]MBD1365008.1 hypothetical protein [Mucilaginibacter pankratovii]
MPDNINIVFICSSLEQGHDGVGDYTRRLSAALIKAGHSCAILSVSDRHTENILESTQQADGVDVPVLRLSSDIEIKKRFEIAKEWVDKIDPQWLSLQFVPFGYHPKGLKLGLSKMLLTLSKGRRWHMMFHELWVGMANEESKKLHLWGQAQRILIKSLIKNLKPAVIHTQTRLYQTLLAKMSFKAGYLPLYSNIPVVGSQSGERAAEGEISFVVFGAIHDKAPIQQFAKEAAQYADKFKRPLTLTIIGRGNNEQQRWAGAWAEAGLPVNRLGELPARQISEVLSGATIGLSATALAVIEKSGSYAAMREHGLHVISVSKAWTPTGVAKPAIPEGVTEYTIGNLEECIADSKFIPYGSSVEQVSAKFARALINLKAE